MSRAVFYLLMTAATFCLSWIGAFQVQTQRCILPSVGWISTSVARQSESTTSATIEKKSILDSFDYNIEEKLPWMEQGHRFWKWRELHDIHYIELGDTSKPALLLIHGFGASAYHFRYNIPDLSRDYHVFAFDMLGFGLSSKPIQDYSAHVWRDQTIDFINQVIQKPTIVAGNSLGGFTALFASASAGMSMIKGCILINAAGRFRNDMNKRRDDEDDDDDNNSIMTKVVNKFKEYAQRFVIWASFIYTKQPARIKQVLQQVYPVNSSMVDDELVRSIQYPSFDPNAAEVFYRVIVKNGNGPQVFVEDLLNQLECPILLCWGIHDPWIRPAAADMIETLYPSKSYRVNINGGHCPHDEAHKEVNLAIRTFLKDIAVD